jgi:hypothetical protein
MDGGFKPPNRRQRWNALVAGVGGVFGVHWTAKLRTTSSASNVAVVARPSAACVQTVNFLFGSHPVASAGRVDAPAGS